MEGLINDGSPKDDEDSPINTSAPIAAFHPDMGVVSINPNELTAGILELDSSEHK